MVLHCVYDFRHQHSLSSPKSEHLQKPEFRIWIQVMEFSYLFRCISESWSDAQVVSYRLLVALQRNPKNTPKLRSHGVFGWNPNTKKIATRSANYNGALCTTTVLQKMLFVLVCSSISVKERGASPPPPPTYFYY